MQHKFGAFGTRLERDILPLTTTPIETGDTETSPVLSCYTKENVHVP